jgi:hypothetical protein
MIRRERFKELVEYALERNSRGGYRISQRQLSQALRCAPGMIRRYLDLETDINGLRYSTLRAMAEVTQLNPGTIFMWIEQGREQAMAYESKAVGSLAPFTPLDLARQLVVTLELERVAPSEPSTEPLLDRIEAIKATVGPVFPRLVALSGAAAALEHLEDGSLPKEEHWEPLSQLLDASSAELMRLCGIKPPAVGGSDASARSERTPA